MSRLTIRPSEAADDDGFQAVRSLVYNDGLPVPEDRRAHKYSKGYVAVDGKEVIGIFNVLPMNATRGAALLECGGVAGVGVAPHRRRGGVGVQMMQWLVRHLRSEGVHLSSLYAYREPFYARTGFAVVGKRIGLTVPLHRMPKVQPKLEVRRLTPEDWRELEPCYERFAHERSGLHVRSELMWKRVLHENKPLTIYAAGDPVEGYVAVSHAVNFWVEQRISEFAWSTPTGYEAGLAMIQQIGINKTSVAWDEPSDSPFYANHLDQGVEAVVHRPVMFRVCDVPGALRLLKPEGTGAFVLEVNDPDVPENRGPWQVRWNDGQVSVDRTDAEPEIVADVGPFTQAFMGDPNVADLARQGKLNCSSSAALKAAASLLVPMAVYCGDFF